MLYLYQLCSRVFRYSTVYPRLPNMALWHWGLISGRQLECIHRLGCRTWMRHLSSPATKYSDVTMWLTFTCSLRHTAGLLACDWSSPAIQYSYVTMWFMWIDLIATTRCSSFMIIIRRGATNTNINTTIVISSAPFTPSTSYQRCNKVKYMLLWNTMRVVWKFMFTFARHAKRCNNSLSFTFRSHLFVWHFKFNTHVIPEGLRLLLFNGWIERIEVVLSHISCVIVLNAILWNTGC